MADRGPSDSHSIATRNHEDRVSLYCVMLGSLAGLDARRCERLRIASRLHDIGKVYVPTEILLKPGPLTAEERMIVELHCEDGHRLLAQSDSELFTLAATVALTHHERWDGSGYPRGLRGEEIPIEGRITAIADVFDAITSDRVYRPAMTLHDALQFMLEGHGSYFDPRLLDLFISELPRFLALRATWRDRPSAEHVPQA